MPFSSSSGPALTIRKVMIFIDGGHLRKFEQDNSSKKIDFSLFTESLMTITSKGLITGELKRVYYYDAIVDSLEEPKKHIEQKLFYDKINNERFYEVKLGRLIKTGDTYRQKGVDTLIAIDMITKAYADHYDIAILVGGDDDLLAAVNAVKDTGKNVYGAYFAPYASTRLTQSLDARRNLNEYLSTFLISRD